MHGRVKERLHIHAGFETERERMPKPANIPLSKALVAATELSAGLSCQVLPQCHTARPEFLLGIAFSHMSWPINGRWQEEGAWMDEEEKVEEEEEVEAVTIVGKNQLTLILEIDWVCEPQFKR